MQDLNTGKTLAPMLPFNDSSPYCFGSTFTRVRDVDHDSLASVRGFLPAAISISVCPQYRTQTFNLWFVGLARQLSVADQLLPMERKRFARLHFVKPYPQFLKFGSKAVGPLDDARKSSEVLRNG